MTGLGFVLGGGWALTATGEEPPVAVPDPVTTTTFAPPVDCIEVANPSLLVTIAADEAAAVALADGWFVAKPNGATWYTTADPTRDAAGELLPMNDQARADSESRREIAADNPLYRGHTDREPSAMAARSCAAERAEVLDAERSP